MEEEASRKGGRKGAHQLVARLQKETWVSIDMMSERATLEAPWQPGICLQTTDS